MIFLYGIFFLLVTGVEFLRKKRTFVDFLSLFHLFFIFSYLVPAIVFLAAPERVREWRYLSIAPEAASSMPVFFAIIGGYLSLLLGFVLGGSEKLVRCPALELKLGEKDQFRRILLPFFGLALGSFLLFAFGHGGILELVLSGWEIRTGKKSASIFDYFFYFSSGLSLCSPLFYGYAKVCHDKKIKKMSSYFLMASTGLAFLSALGTAGRGKILMVFLPLFLTWLNFQPAKLTAKKIAVGLGLALFSIFLVVSGKSILGSLGSLKSGFLSFPQAVASQHQAFVGVSEKQDLVRGLIFFARNMDHPLASVYVAMYFPAKLQAPRLFFDWLRALLDILPGVHQTPLVVTGTPSSLNRDFFGLSGYAPPHWVAMKIMNGGLLWLVGGSCLAGFLGGWLNTTLNKSLSESPIVPGLLILLAFFWKDVVVGADPFMVYSKNLSLFLLLLIIAPWISGKDPKKTPSSE